MEVFKIQITSKLIDFVYFSHAIIFMIALLTLPQTALTLSTVIYVISLDRCIKQHLSSSRVSELQLIESGWKLSKNNEKHPIIAKEHNHFLAPWMTILNFKQSWFRYNTIIIFPGQLDSEHFCHLRALLKWKKIKQHADHQKL